METTMETPYSMSFEDFWAWVIAHPNCVLRAGTPETVLYDHEEFFWNFAVEGPNQLVVQVLRGKRLVGEMLIDPEPIAFVQSLPPERDSEFVFELVAENEDSSFPAYFFVLAHGFDEDMTYTAARIH